ncbi:hypothetical protein [Pandoraea sp. NPDC090278]|uniref:hypothetical protein n=1 Tax=Pandoraea sp. NPDC090278 TaxID=3364391 RepID=UPI00383BCC69
MLTREICSIFQQKHFYCRKSDSLLVGRAPSVARRGRLRVTDNVLWRPFRRTLRYGELFEQAWLEDADRAKSDQELPDSIKPAVLHLLSDDTTLDARPLRDFWVQAELLEHTWQQWSTLLAQLPALLQEAGVPGVTQATKRNVLEPMAQRIEYLRALVQQP